MTWRYRTPTQSPSSVAPTWLCLGSGSVSRRSLDCQGQKAIVSLRRRSPRAWDLGLRLHDTAPRNGFGESERRAGDALRAQPRTEFVLSTKVGWLLRAERGVSTSGNTTATALADFSYRGTMQSFEESLARLGLDRIDILHIHDPNDHFREAREGSLKALVELRGKGAIGAVSAGMNQAPLVSR